MAKEKKDRYASVMDLHEEVQAHLEGEKKKEFNRQMAAMKVAEGKSLFASLGELRETLKEQEQSAKEKEKAVKAHWPIEKKKELWELEVDIRRRRREIIQTFTKVATAFQEALGFERRNPDARAALADLYWDQYLREEEAGDESQMVLYENLVREYEDGQYQAKLKGDGTLSVTTWSFPCRCLTEGREVAPEELIVSDYHPLSGRSLSGPGGAEGLRELELREPIRLKIHGESCRPEAVEDAHVWLFRFEERHRIRVPVFPDGIDRGAEEPDAGNRLKAVLDSLIEPESPTRPENGLYLGKTPLPPFTLPRGSYLLILDKPGYGPVRAPVYIDRLAREKIEITLYREEEIPSGFVQVPAGKFIFQGDRENPQSPPKQIRETGDFFLSKFSITSREYLTFLNDLAERDAETARKRVPRKSPQGGGYWPQDAEGKFHIPTETWIRTAPEKLREQASKPEAGTPWWEEDWPVFGVSWEDLLALVNHHTKKEKRLFTLPHELQWEKAARGTDGRLYPWGDEYDSTFCNSIKSHEGGDRPCPVDSFPMDDSPFGIRGLGGNCRDTCLNDPGEQYPGWCVCRGGHWKCSMHDSRASYRTGNMIHDVNRVMGGRLTWIPRLYPEQEQTEGSP
jgi:formylglycine-generating enzyme required for sulfatase activity